MTEEEFDDIWNENIAGNVGTTTLTQIVNEHINNENNPHNTMLIEESETLWSGDITASTTLTLSSAYTEYTLIIVEWGLTGFSNAKKHDVFYVPSISGTMCVTGNSASAALTFSGTSVTVGAISGVRLYKVIGIKWGINNV